MKKRAKRSPKDRMYTTMILELEAIRGWIKDSMIEGIYFDDELVRTGIKNLVQLARAAKRNEK